MPNQPPDSNLGLPRYSQLRRAPTGPEGLLKVSVIFSTPCSPKHADIDEWATSLIDLRVRYTVDYTKSRVDHLIFDHKTTYSSVFSQKIAHQNI